MRFDDPSCVREQYASECGLEARRSLYRETGGQDAREVAFAAVAEVSPRRVLEVGCGPGEMAARISAELGAAVVAVDMSERMVELARARGVDANVGDVQALPFREGEFDCALAAWMLFHAADLDGAIGELARVLRAAGRLVAVTNGSDHLAEIWELLGAEPVALSFRSENGAGLLRRCFAHVEARDVEGTVTVRDADALRAYLASSNRGKPFVGAVPEFHEPFVARRHNTVFVAER